MNRAILHLGCTGMWVVCSFGIASLGRPDIAEAQVPETPAVGELPENEGDAAGSDIAEPSAEDIAEARYRFNQGSLSYGAGHFDEAVTHFEAAYRLSHRDEMLYNLFLAHRDGADLASAVDALSGYLNSGVASALAPQRARLEGTLVAMRARLAGTATSETAEDAPAGVEEPRRATLDDETLTPARTETVDADQRGGGSLRMGLSLGLLAIAAGALATGTVMQLKRKSEAERLDDECQLGPDANGCPAGLDQEELSSRHARFGAIRWVGFGVAAAAAAAGLTLLLLPQGDTDTHVAAACDGFGCALGVGGTF